MKIADMYEKVFEDLVMDYCDRNAIFLNKKERERVVRQLMYYSPGMWQHIENAIEIQVNKMKEDE